MTPKTVTGNIFNASSRSKTAKSSPVNYKETWGKEAGTQPGLMLEVINLRSNPFRHVGFTKYQPTPKTG